MPNSPVVAVVVADWGGAAVKAEDMGLVCTAKKLP